MNRCQEWGAPRVSILSAVGGDEQHRAHPGAHNQDPEWTEDPGEHLHWGPQKGPPQGPQGP